MKAGFEVLHEPAWARSVVEAPWEVARAIAARVRFPGAGEPAGAVAMVERQPIRAIVGGRSFASNDGPAPLHTDSQLWRGRPAHLQVLLCVRPAAEGGESLLADADALLDDVARSDPALHDALFRAPRSFPFVFGDFVATTVAARDRDLFFTCSPRADDPIGAALRRRLAALPTTRLPLRAGDALLVDNHRCLHGRTPFRDREPARGRELQRLLIWLATPPPRDEGRLARALREGEAPRRTGARPTLEALPLERRRAIFEALLRGEPPGVIAGRERIPEPWLYWVRDELGGGAGGA